MMRMLPESFVLLCYMYCVISMEKQFIKWVYLFKLRSVVYKLVQDIYDVILILSNPNKLACLFSIQEDFEITVLP